MTSATSESTRTATITILYSIVAVGLLSLFLLYQERRWWCSCGGWNPWSSDAGGAHNSQHLFDPYSFSHLLHGVIFYGIFSVFLRGKSESQRTVLTILAECCWEALENTSYIIDRYRAETIALGYRGDSIINAWGDVLSCYLGYKLAGRLGLYGSTILFIVVELILLAWIRDNLTLNILMLIHPISAIRNWQAA